MLSLNDLEREYLELKKENFPDSKRIKFIANLGASDEIAYHYELICKEWQEGRQLNLESSFDRHGGAGLEFLFERLAKKSDQKLKIETICLIAQILTKSKHRDFYTAFCDRLIPQITSFLGTNDALRRKLIIALGWVGTLEQIDILIGEMLGRARTAFAGLGRQLALCRCHFTGPAKQSCEIKQKPHFCKVSLAKKSYTLAQL
ncbi:HEAT repeat domain-containing protein [Campylobacter concisus]|uniref:HEAT repeat domain-containing protein n=1 Tax=Campylobacter concisus TaxID=199 RepID=UPI001F2F5A3B|nr:HEAT repeat domain-containing protein [Campylobacter concisus]